MVLLCGIPTETPLARVREELLILQVPHVMFNQRRFADTAIEFEITQGRLTGTLSLDWQQFRLEEFTGVYSRLMDHRHLPELNLEGEDSSRRINCNALHDTLCRWLEVAPCRVVNRVGPMATNFSKPYQAQLVRRQGFAVPETLISNDPEAVLKFQRRRGQLIYKSISSVRSIVQVLENKDLERLDHIRWCPVQFQELIAGTNVRVHTVNHKVFATAIRTAAVDYRYAHRLGAADRQFEALTLPADLRERCLRLSQALGLEFAGIDLMITSDNRVYCLEVNTSPAFPFYEDQTGQPIANALARFLAGFP